MPQQRKVLLPGGIGYIGSHTMVDLLISTGSQIVVVDDYSNCQADVLERILEAVATEGIPVEVSRKRISLYVGNVVDLGFLNSVFEKEANTGKPITTIIHFAAKKSTYESILLPLLYFENNFVGTLNLLKMMQKHKDCREILFSSTAAIYGNQDDCTENFKSQPLNPYGQSKLCVQIMLKSAAKAHPQWRVIALRYFNPGGCHKSGFIGDWPCGYPNNLFPVIQQVILGKRTQLPIYGNDYATPDGTGVRDYIHVMDLASGHLRAMDKFNQLTDQNNYELYNLGTGIGYSVLQVVQAFQKALGAPIKYKFAPRRDGDTVKLVAGVKKANNELGWKAERTLQEQCDSCVKFTLTTQKRMLGDEKKQ